MPTNDNPHRLTLVPQTPTQMPPPNALVRQPTENEPVVYTLPIEVWDEIERELPAGTLGSEVLMSEREASRLSGDHRGLVGTIAGQSIPFSHLRPNLSMTLDLEEAEFLGLNPAEVSQLARTRNSTFEASTLQAHRGYLGWLMTHKLFIDEHDQLVSDFVEEFRRNGFIHMRLTEPPKWVEPVAGRRAHEFKESTNIFLLRWRLAGLDGPYLPVPQSILLAGQIPQAHVETFQQSGGLFYIPDTIPIPARDELRNYLSNQLRKAKLDPREDPIAGWREIIRNDNSARTQIRRYARIFELQHYWRMIHVRHGESLQRKKGHLQQAMAKYFETSVKSIKADLQLVQNGLGEGWETRKSPLE